MSDDWWSIHGCLRSQEEGRIISPPDNCGSVQRGNMEMSSRWLVILYFFLTQYSVFSSIDPTSLHFNDTVGKSHQLDTWGSTSIHKALLCPKLCWTFLQSTHLLSNPPHPTSLIKASGKSSSTSLALARNITMPAPIWSCFPPPNSNPASKLWSQPTCLISKPAPWFTYLLAYSTTSSQMDLFCYQLNMSKFLTS